MIHELCRSSLLLAPFTLTVLLAAACTSTVATTHPNGQLAKSGELAAGDQEGPWSYYYAKGQRQAEGAYHDDVQVGPWTYWFENGQREMEGAFEDERRTGEWTYWHENGQLRARGRFEQGFEAGLWEFFAADGSLERRGRFEQGRPVLRWCFTRPDGTLAAEGLYWEGVKVGPWQYAEADGARIERLYPLPDGLEPCVERWESGAPRREGFLRDGKPAGPWVSWNEDGTTRLEARFEDGLASGPVRAFRADGGLLACGSARRGALSGELHSPGGTSAPLPPRPLASWSGTWSSARLAEEAPATHVVETWLAELASPLEPAALSVTELVPTPAPLPAQAAREHETTSVPAAPVRAQPWTVREEANLSRYVENYGDGPRAGELESGRYEDEERPQRRPEGDRERSAALLGRSLPRTRFPTADGGMLDLGECRGRKLVLTVLRGFGGQVCVYCAAQTKALARSARDFARLETEVVVVYPGPKAALDAFLEAYARTFDGERPPYRVVYDSDLELTRGIGIQENLARPTSLILDPDGVVRYAYVGRNIEDRPAASRLLGELEELAEGGTRE